MGALGGASTVVRAQSVSPDFFITNGQVSAEVLRGNTLYVGGQTPSYEIFSIIDISQWRRRDADGNPLGPPRVISQESGRGHSVRTA